MIIKNKVALVTGGSKGIGKAISIALAKNGFNLCIASRNIDNLKAVVSEIKPNANIKIIYHKTDVSNPKDIDALIEKVIEEFGTIDVLINNSGGPNSGTFLEQNDENWLNAINQNLLSVVRLTKVVVPIMKNKNGGRIINISSTIAKEPTPGMVLSATARAGVLAFSKAISEELAPYNITINTVCPGGVLTERLETLVQEISQKEGISYQEQLNKSLSMIPMKRFAEPHEIANLVTFLSSDESSYITGETIRIDGALTKSVY